MTDTEKRILEALEARVRKARAAMDETQRTQPKNIQSLKCLSSRLGEASACYEMALFVLRTPA